MDFQTALDWGISNVIATDQGKRLDETNGSRNGEPRQEMPIDRLKGKGKPKGGQGMKNNFWRCFEEHGWGNCPSYGYTCSGIGLVANTGYEAETFHGFGTSSDEDDDSSHRENQQEEAELEVPPPLAPDTPPTPVTMEMSPRHTRTGRHPDQGREQGGGYETSRPPMAEKLLLPLTNSYFC